MRIIWTEKQKNNLIKYLIISLRIPFFTLIELLAKLLNKLKVSHHTHIKVAKFPNMSEKIFGKFFIIPIVSFICLKKTILESKVSFIALVCCLMSLSNSGYNTLKKESVKVIVLIHLFGLVYLEYIHFNPCYAKAALDRR